MRTIVLILSAYRKLDNLSKLLHTISKIAPNGKRIRDASIYTSKKNIAQVLFLSDIFLFPFIRQQFPVLT